MIRKIVIGLISFIAVVALVRSLSKSKKDFAPQLAEDIIETWSKGAKKGEISFFSDLDYDDIGKGIVLHRKGMDLFGGIFGGDNDKDIGLAEQIVLRAELQRKGYDLGLNMGGSIDLIDYKTGFGDFNNQRLGWGISTTSKTVVCHVKGTILNDNEKPIEVNYKFQVDNDSEGLSSKTIKMLGGQIKDGKEVTEVNIE